jgi:dimethylamine monooxygenase subunit A
VSLVLHSEHVPFPVSPAFRIRPDMRRWDGDDRGHLRLDARYPEYLADKLRLLAADPAGCRVMAPDADREALTNALVHAARNLAQDARHAGAFPAPIVADGDVLAFPLLGVALAGGELSVRPEPGTRQAAGVIEPALVARVRAHLDALAPLERLADALALAVQEDVVVVQAGEGLADGRAELLHVCFPSAWDPAARAGAGFAALHAPVPHGEVLRAAGAQVVRAMVSKGPFVRYVWSLVPDGRLDRNPRRNPDLRTATVPSALWFRVERQTVMPLPELGRALFTIRVYRAPLASVLTSPQRKRTLAAAVASMDDALLAYKGVGAMKDALLAWLEPAAPA